MIHYDQGSLGIGPSFFSVRGSVIPKSLLWGVASSLIAVGLFFFWGGWDSENSEGRSTVATAYTGYGFVLGFLVVYRMQLAHARYWEAVTLCNEMRAEWLEPAGSLFSFCTPKPEMAEKVLLFKHLLVRLMSQIHRTSMERLTKDTGLQLP